MLLFVAGRAATRRVPLRTSIVQQKPAGSIESGPGGSRGMPGTVERRPWRSVQPQLFSNILCWTMQSGSDPRPDRLNRGEAANATKQS